MADLIDRQMTINEIKALYEWHDTVTEDRVIDHLKRLPSADVQPIRWISCSELLPAKKTEVIYSLENHYVSTGYMTDRDYNGNEMELHWEDMESGALIYPEAWMPLPKPYEGSE